VSADEVVVERVPVEALEGLRPQAVEVWSSAHGLPPSSPTRAEFGSERLPRHARRPDFRFFGAFLPDGGLVGLVYGYTGAHGQWWHDRVAAAMDAETRARWIEPTHFEFTELAVAPERQGRGIGGRLHDAVLEGLPHGRALLSALADNAPVVAFYERRGWRIVVPELQFERGRPVFCVMGRELPAGR
jgi:ribosomal protein S18 acetylase RimI-like enzyme